MKTTFEEVESFLKEFKARMATTGIIILEIRKNLQGMFALEINAGMRREILKSLKAEDYYRGPSTQSGWTGEAWEFGKIVNNKETYIKVSMGVAKSVEHPDQEGVVAVQKVICISFHPAEKPITYPFKK